MPPGAAASCRQMRRVWANNNLKRAVQKTPAARWRLKRVNCFLQSREEGLWCCHRGELPKPVALQLCGGRDGVIGQLSGWH